VSVSARPDSGHATHGRMPYIDGTRANDRRTVRRSFDFISGDGEGRTATRERHTP
jgi:hypothetical protein